MEVLPLTMVNLMQRSDSATDDHSDNGTRKHSSGNSGVMNGAFDLFQQGTSEQIAKLESESDSGSSEESDEEHQKGVAVTGESEFGNTELEDLMLKEGPQ